MTKKELMKKFLNYLINDITEFGVDMLLIEKDDEEYRKIKSKYKNLLKDLEYISKKFDLEIDVYDSTDDFVICFPRRCVNNIHKWDDKIYESLNKK